MDLVENRDVITNINLHPWELVRLGFIQETVANIASKATKEVVLIDIGCGDAFVIKNLSDKFNFSAFHAVDINFTDHQIAELKKQNPKIDFQSQLSAISISQNKSYILLLNDVIEHIEEDQKFIEMLKAKVIDKASSISLFITVPAFNSVFSSHDVDLGHYRRYTLKMLLKYNETLKMNISAKGYFFALLLAARLVQKLFSPKTLPPKKENIGISVWKHGKIMTDLVTFFLKSDLLFTKVLAKCKLTIPGLSTYSVFSKK